MDTPVPKQNIPLEKSLRHTRGGFGLWIFLGILCVMTIGVVAVMFSRKEVVQIDEVQIIGVKTFPEREISAFTREYLAGMKLGVIPRSSSLFFSKRSLQKTIQKQFPIVDLVYVSFVNPKTIGITIRERTPESVWCFSENSCGFIDRLGILYGESPRFSDGVYTVFSSEEEKVLPDFLGEQIIEPELMYRFDQLFKKMQNEDIVISRVHFMNHGDVGFIIERLFKKYPNENVAILGTLTQNDEDFLRDITIGLDHEVFQKQYTEKPKDLEYIDLRFPGKIFYKFTGKEKPLEKVKVETVEVSDNEIENED